MFSKHTYRLVAYTLRVNMVHTLYVALHTMYFALHACRTFGYEIYVDTHTYLRSHPVYAVIRSIVILNPYLYVVLF